MNKNASSSLQRASFLAATFIIAMFLAGCSGGLLGDSSWPGLSANDSTAYLAYNQAVTAIDLESGRTLWVYPNDPDRDMTFFAPPAVSEGDLIIAGGYDNVVYALDKATGQERWSQPLQDTKERIIGAPTIVGDQVFVPSSSGRLYAFSLENGEPLWRQPFSAQEDLWAPPLVSDDSIYVASLDHTLYALDDDTGAVEWSRDMGGAMADRPTLADGLLLVGTFAKELIALDASDGRLVWSFTAEDWLWSAPEVNGELAYFGDVSGTAHAVEVQSGREVWRATLDGAIAARPLFSSGTVFFVTDLEEQNLGKVYALDAANGRTVWSGEPELNGRLLSDPVQLDSLMLVASVSSECLLYTIEMESGASRCLFQPEQ
jgi:outer membrane protein assembly factor BamB